MQVTIDGWGDAPAAIRFLPTRPLSSVPRCRECAFLTKVLDKGKLIQHVMAGGSPNGQFQLFMWWQSCRPVYGDNTIMTQLRTILEVIGHSGVFASFLHSAPLSLLLDQRSLLLVHQLSPHWSRTWKLKCFFFCQPHINYIEWRDWNLGN